MREWLANSRSSSSWHLTTAKNATSVATNSSKALESTDRIMSKPQTCGVSGAEEKRLGLVFSPSDGHQAFSPERQSMMKLETPAD